MTTHAPPAPWYQTPSVQPVQNHSTQNENQRRRGSSFFLAFCIFCTIFIIFLVALIIVLIFAVKSYNLDAYLENHVRIFPDEHAMGDVILKYDDYMGIIDGESMTLENAHVICRQMGHPEAIAFTRKATFQSYARPSFILERLSCEGWENTLEECVFSHRDNIDTIETEFDVAGVVCLDNQLQDHKYFLIHGQDRSEGNVLVTNENGYLGPVCDDNWAKKEGHIFCRAYGFASAYKITTGSYYAKMPMKFSTNGFTCFGFEKELLDCPYKTFSYCTEYEAAGVVCSMQDLDEYF